MFRLVEIWHHSMYVSLNLPLLPILSSLSLSQRLAVQVAIMTWVSNVTPAVDTISQWRSIFAICAVLSMMSLIIVSLRIWVSFRGHGLGANDYMAMLAVVFGLVYSTLAIVQTKYGLGLPLKLRSTVPSDALAFKQANFAGRPIYQLGVSFFKISLLLSYLRLIQDTDQRTYEITVWFAITVIFIGHLGSSLALVFACKPVSFSWSLPVEGDMEHPTCLNVSSAGVGYSIITIVSDILVVMLPIPILVKLNIPTRKKVGIIGLFLLGLFTTICSIMRYVQLGRISYGDGNSTMLVLWGTIEFNVGVCDSSKLHTHFILKLSTRPFSDFCRT